MLTGNDVVAGVKTIHYKEDLSSLSDKLNLSKTPNGAIVSLYKLNADGTNGTEYTLGDPSLNTTEYSISGKQITLHADTADGTKFRVYYKTDTASDAKTVKVTSSAFGGSFKIILDVLVVDEFTKDAFQGQLIVPNGKFEDNFELS